jgi:hypothetical protein
MNPIVSTRCARRVLMVLAAMTSVLLMVGCGSSGNPIIPPLGGGFSNASLKGQYVMRQTGTGVNQTGTSADPFSETTVFTADGSTTGNLNILVDDFDQDGVQLVPTLPETGTYIIAKDGTGSLSFGGSNYAITMIDDRHFYLIEGDPFATSSGYGQMQDTTAFTAAPSGTFVFKAHNIDTSSRVGGITITAGAISGTEDLLSAGLLATSQRVTSSVAMSLPNSTTGRGTFKLTDGTSFGYYVVNSTEFYFMSDTNSLEIGQAEAQTGGPFSAATLANGTSYVFGSSGDTNVSGPAGIHSAGVFTTDGVSAITGGAVDYVQDTTVNSDPVSGGSYTLASTGRGTINLTLTGGSISPQIFWMVNGTRAYFLADSTTAVEDGTFSLQQVAPTLSGQAAFVMDGFDTTLKDRVGDFETTSSTAFNWNETSNAFLPSALSGQVSVVGTAGTYGTISSNGRVAVVVNGVTLNGVTPGVVFYLSAPNTGFMVQEDGADIGGAFTQQASQ